MKLSAPKGTRDLLPPETYLWQHVESVFADVCSRFGYREIRLPTFEQTELFQRGVGEVTDIVQKEMYTFPDKGGRSMTLRPEGTAGVVRSYIENGLASWPSPVRLYYNITAFRYENVQKGRYREFHQFGCEAFGAAGPVVDAELISLLAIFFKEVGLEQTSLRINSIGCPECRQAYLDLLKEWLRPHLGQLCQNCQERYERNPLRIIDCKENACQQVTAEAPAQADHLCPACQEHFTGLQHHLEVLQLPFTVDKKIVRGLDYYSRTVFEFISDHVGTQGTICGGGRYDGLVEMLGGQATPGIGFALGVERLLLELSARQVHWQPDVKMDLYLAVAGNGRDAAQDLCRRLRLAGICCETDLLERSLKAQLRYAARSGADYVVVVGDTEAATGQARLRDLASGTEEEIELAGLAEIIKTKKTNRQKEQNDG